MKKRKHIWLAAIPIVLGVPIAAQAAPFTAGNIVVEQIGNGSAALSSASQAVFLNEYTPTGTLVQSIAMPTTASGAQQPLTESGTASTDGMITLSPNGQYLTVSGYDTGLGTAAVASSSATTVNRVVGLVNGAGTVDTTTHAAFFSNNNFRGAVTTDGTGFYVGGTGTAPDKGVLYLPYGGSSATTINSTIASDGINIFGNTLYSTSTTSTATSIVQIGTSGTLPTSAASATNLSGLPLGSSSDSPHQFLIFNEGGNQVAYIADDTGSALSKYELVSGNWASEGKVGTGANDVTGLTGVLSGTTVTLYATLLNGDSTSGSAAQLISLVDSSGAGGSLTGTSTTLLMTAGANKTFAGVAFAPVIVAAPEPASVALAVIGFFALVGYGWCRRRAA
jgi:hypothetical protein